MREGGGFESSYAERPRINVVEARLEAMALQSGQEIELATPERSAEWILFQRMLYLLVEESQDWDPQQKANLRRALAALGAFAYPHFRESERNIFVDNFMYLYEEGEIGLDGFQAGMVSRLSGRVGLDFSSEPTTISFTPPDRKKRITEVEDPVVTKFIQDAPADDKIGYILRNISTLSLKQKVKLLLSLSDAEYQAFKERRQAGFEDIVADVLSNPGLIPDKKERIRALSTLRSGVPRYEAEAEIRREWHGKYPSRWDEELEEDSRFKPNDGLPRMRNGRSLTYEEAVEFERFENARKFYRGRYFPAVAREDNPLPISIDTLYEAFKAYGQEISKEGKPGTDISTKDLIAVLDYYLDYESENEENCKEHKKVKSLAQLISTIEEAIG